MKIVRSILAIIIGIVVAMVGISLMHGLSGLIYAPPPGLEEEFAKSRQGVEMDRAKVLELIQSMPLGALVMVLLSWETGSFLGGAVAALIASAGRLIHAGVIGAVVLAGTIANIFMIPGHPNWLILAGLLLPLPVSLAAGWIVTMLLPPPAAAPPVDAIQAGEPPARPWVNG